MAAGTAGYTAALCVRALEAHHVAPASGAVLVTGASGGVGSFAVILLAAMGYDVIAATRTPDAAAYLTSLGAREVVSSDEIGTDVRALGKQRWAGAIDTVGGSVLAGVVSATNAGGAVAACGNAGGMDFPSSVAPFILRGVTLVGIDSVQTPVALRNDAWALLAAQAPHDALDAVTEEVALADAIPGRSDCWPTRSPAGSWSTSAAEAAPTTRGGRMSGALDGQRAIVVGGGSGIGFGCAHVLARDGAAVTIVGRTEGKLRDAQVRLADDGLTVSYVVCDALDGDSVRAAVAAASDDDGRLHIAVVVPGGGSITPVLLFDDDQFSREVDNNVRPVYLLLKYAGRAMVRAGSGSFVAISSTAAVFSARYLASYSAGKAAVDQLVRVAANELGQYGIRVNSVQPGMTRTPMTAGTFANEKMIAAFVDGQAIARGGEVDDQANAVRYFAGPESGWTTGQLLTVDGGHTLRAFPDYDELIDLPDQRDVILSEGS